MHAYRSHTCGALTRHDVGAQVRLSGWVHRVRDHGGLLFIDLRDHYGITQIVADPDSPAFAIAETVRGEWVIRVDGEVKARTPETVNPNLATGAVEVFARAVEVLSEAHDLPLPVFGEPDYPEDIRLKYRFLDLRRDTLHANIVRRTRIVARMREEMAAAGFTEYSTPILTASSPEGARDFLVPSRIHPGRFYALPQAPQQYKQLLMVSGFDRYFQIAPCFRDEDARADRSPGEFYQLDLEMSFVTQEDVFAAVEPVLRGLFVGVGVWLVALPFVDLPMAHPLWVLAFAVFGGGILGSMGVLGGIWAEKFDQLSAFQNFLIMPLTMLSGVFYSIHSLPPLWQDVSHVNPFFFMIDGFRYGFFGQSDVSPWLSLGVVGFCFVFLAVLTLAVLARGYKLRA